MNFSLDELARSTWRQTCGIFNFSFDELWHAVCLQPLAPECAPSSGQSSACLNRTSSGVAAILCEASAAAYSLSGELGVATCAVAARPKEFLHIKIVCWWCASGRITGICTSAVALCPVLSHSTYRRKRTVLRGATPARQRGTTL